MAADKPLQEVFSTVRIPVTDAILGVDSQIAYGSVSNFGGFQSDNSQFVNCYPEFFTDRSQNQYASQFDTVAQKRRAFNATAQSIANGTIPTAAVTTWWDNICITGLDDVYVGALWDSTNSLIRVIQYRPSANTSLQIGTIAGAAVTDTLYLTEIVVAGLPYLAVSYMNAAETTTTGLYAASAAGVFTAASLTVIGDADFPANIATTHIRGSFIQIDGYTCIITKEGGLYNSDFNSITAWNALGVVQTNAYPDQGIGLARYKNMVVAFGEDSIEFFTDQGKPPPAGPFGRTDQAFIKFGASFAKGIKAINDQLYWWSKSSTGQWGLFKLDGGFAPVKISTLRDDLIAARGFFLPELYILMDGARPHIISNIEISSSILTMASAVGFTGDPFSLNNTEISQPGWLCWDTVTGNSWTFLYTSNNLAFPLQAQNFSTAASFYTNLTANMTVFSSSAPRTITGAAGFANTVLQSATDNVAQSVVGYIDAALGIASVGGAGGAVTSAIVFNTWDFGNEKQKRIHKFKVLQRQYGTSDSNDPLTPYTWVLYNKQDFNFSTDNLQIDSGITRTFVRPCVQNALIPRTYLNNLGTARKWSFAIVQRSDMNFACKGIELDISQGSA